MFIHGLVFYIYMILASYIIAYVNKETKTRAILHEIRIAEKRKNIVECMSILDKYSLEIPEVLYIDLANKFKELYDDFTFYEFT